ncbi:MAG: bifunctional UDP-N-acetylglucosamine diphosphorylase/glucosamine-1-phosphate N-acetyltransferase GlmU [Candidatus Omnitrophota bacterium]
MQAIVLAAGKGTRMKSELPKVLHPILELPLLEYVLRTLTELGIRQPVIVAGYRASEVRAFAQGVSRKYRIAPRIVLQKDQRGTGHAVLTAAQALRDKDADILVWPGDMPFVGREAIRRLQAEHRHSGASATVLSALQPDPSGYGRILRAGGRFFAIREELDATEAERRVTEVNTGVYLFRTRDLLPALRKLRPENRKKELYLTDVIEILAQAGRKVSAVPAVLIEEGFGINRRADLAKAVRIMNQRETEKHMKNGVTLVAPEQTFIGVDVKIGTDTVIYPWCYIEPGVRIGRKCRIGPFAKLRKGTVIQDGAVIGSYVEVTRSRIGKKASAKHLAYLGDAEIGEGTNIGAGVITANYDGVRKQRTRVGRRALIGSNTVMVAPVRIGDGVRTGAGAVIKGGTKARSGETWAGVPARLIQSQKKKKR